MPLLWDFAKKNCLVFSNAHSNSTWTKPSHVTMLTGILQSKHGVEYRDSSIPEEIVMVQERLKQTGYHTVAFTGGGFANKRFGMGRGFDSFYQSRVSPGAEESELARHFERIRLPLDKATEFLNRPDTASGPTFIFVHTYEVHEWWLHYFPPETALQNRKQKDQQWEQFRSETSFKQKRQVYGRTAREFDRRLMDFLRALLSSQYKDNLRIIITSDHGEGLGDKHGDFMRLRHAGPPYSDQIRIPLIVYGTGKGTSDRLTGIDDITPLILWLAGIADSPLIDDRDILISEYISKERDDPNRTVAIFTPEGKYLLSPDGVLHLYRDPEDSVDLLHPEGIGEERTEIPENLKQELEALGYLE
jgi:arylsulfatase A-like enzyme